MLHSSKNMLQLLEIKAYIFLAIRVTPGECDFFHTDKRPLPKEFT